MPHLFATKLDRWKELEQARPLDETTNISQKVVLNDCARAAYDRKLREHPGPPTHEWAGVFGNGRLLILSTATKPWTSIVTVMVEAGDWAWKTQAEK